MCSYFVLEHLGIKTLTRNAQKIYSAVKNTSVVMWVSCASFKLPWEISGCAYDMLKCDAWESSSEVNSSSFVPVPVPAGWFTSSAFWLKNEQFVTKIPLGYRLKVRFG